MAPSDLSSAVHRAIAPPIWLIAAGETRNRHAARALRTLPYSNTQLQATRNWYVDVLGMREGWHPDFKFPVVWFYLRSSTVWRLDFVTYPKGCQKGHAGYVMHYRFWLAQVSSHLNNFRSAKRSF